MKHLIILIGFLCLSSCTPDTYERVEVKITYCDNRPAETMRLVLYSGSRFEVSTYKQAVPVLYVTRGGITQYKLINVCDYVIVSTEPIEK